MKFTLTITDATEEEILNFLQGTNETLITPTAPVTESVAAPVTQPEQPIIQMPQNVNDSDDDETGDEIVSTPSGELDADGLPWDERIHASTKTKTAKGVWTKRRGVAEEFKDEIEAELRKQGSVTPEQPTVQQMPQTTMPTMPQQQPVQQMPQTTMPQQQPVQQQPVQQMPTVQQMPQQQPVQIGEQAAPAMDFHAFMQHLAGLMNKKDTNGNPLCAPDYLNSVAQRVGQAYGVQMGSITDLSQQPDKIGYAVQILQLDGRW